MHLGFSDIIATAVSLAWSGFRYGMRHLQRNSPKEHIGADMQEFGKLVYLIRAESDSASAFLRDRGP